MSVRVKAGPVGTPLTRWRAQRMQELRRDELARVRRSSEQWRTGLAGFLTVVITAAFVAGRDSIAGRSGPTQALIGIFALLAVLAGAAGLYLSNQAATGVLRLHPAAPTVAELLAAERRAAALGLHHLRLALWSAAVCLLAMLACTATVWYG